MICGQLVNCTSDKDGILRGTIVCFGSTYGAWAIVQLDNGEFRSFGLDRLKLIEMKHGIPGTG